MSKAKEMQNDEVLALEFECEQLFSPEQWLPNAAKRAGQINISSHPCTFSHPSARKNKNGYVTSVIASASQAPDGYLRTGNAQVQGDALGNAAALDVYKFLTLEMQNGETLLQHIQHDSDLAKELLSIETENYQTLKDGFLAMTLGSDKSITSSKIKQVYFPAGNNYHQLSILSNSGIIYELRHRIDALRFSENQKILRERKRNNQPSEKSFSEIYDITTIGYGGTKPQNISVLNNQHGGKARLLLSVPPTLVKRDIQFPVKNFFTNAIRYYDIHDALLKLHSIFKIGLDSMIPRRNLESGRDHRIEEILDVIIPRMAALRSIAEEQYREETSQLPQYQKIWLCPEYRLQREKEDEWLMELCKEITLWIGKAYQKTIKKSVTLGSAEREYLKGVITTHREALR